MEQFSPFDLLNYAAFTLMPRIRRWSPAASRASAVAE